MYFFSWVKIVQTLQNWLDDGGNLFLGELFFGDLHDIGDTASNTVFHNNP